MPTNRFANCLNATSFTKKVLLVLTFFVLTSHFTNAQIGSRETPIDVSTYTATRVQVEAKITAFENLLATAEDAGHDVEKEKMTLNTAKVFLEYAQNDEATKNLPWVENAFNYINEFHGFGNNSKALVENLPKIERTEIITMLDEGTENLQKIISGEITRNEYRLVAWNNIAFNGLGNNLYQDGKPIFAHTYNWMPKKAGAIDLKEYYGANQSQYIDLNWVQRISGEWGVTNNRLNNIDNTNNAGVVFLGHNNLPLGLFNDYPRNIPNTDPYNKKHVNQNQVNGAGNISEVQLGASHYTKYDIDHPAVRTLWDTLISNVVPRTRNKPTSRLGYIMTNEPHWNVVQERYAPVIFSPKTREKLVDWLQTKHGTIANLNVAWNRPSGSEFSSFTQAVANTNVPFYNSINDGKWYDLHRFNQERVTDWYTFISQKIKAKDPNAKPHIKLIPAMWTDNRRGEGLDFEALTRLSGISGNDAKALNSYLPQYTRGNLHPFETEWHTNGYSYYWRIMSMSYDFFKSVKPDNIIMNTETHFLSTFKFRDMFLEPEYARSVYWLATLKGMSSAINWYWLRDESGKLYKKGSPNSMPGTSAMQPRIVNEVMGTVMDLNANSEIIDKLQNLNKPIRIFYSETSAICGSKDEANGYMHDTYDLYRRLHFKGLPLGFATKDIILNENNNDWEAIFIYKTPNVTQAEMDALQDYLDGGGTIVKDSGSLQENEYGVPHTTSLSGNVRTRNLAGMETQFTQILDDTGTGAPVVASGSDKCFNVSYFDSADDSYYISLVNLGKNTETVDLTLRNGATIGNVTDLMTGQEVGTTVSLNRYGVLLLEIKQGVTTATEPTFELTVEESSCSDSDTGSFRVLASAPVVAPDKYKISINGNPPASPQSEFFVQNRLYDELPAGTHDIVISRKDDPAVLHTETITISEKVPLSATTSVDEVQNKATITLSDGTAPFDVSVNGSLLFQTTETVLTIDVEDLDIIEIIGSDGCGDLYTTTIEYTSGPDISYTIENFQESCSTEDTGVIFVKASERANNGEKYNIYVDGIYVKNMFQQTKLNDMAPGSYEVCIEQFGVVPQTCQTIVIGERQLRADFTLNSSVLSITITEGTGPYTIERNGEEVYTESEDTTYSLNVSDGDVITVYSDVNCEGVVSESVEIAGYIETVYTITSEPSCPDTPTGSITIVPSRIDIDHYVELDNGTADSFSNELVLENLTEGTHYFCLTPEGGSEQCFEVDVSVLETLQVDRTPKAGTNNVTEFNVTSGTGPFSVAVNGTSIGTQNTNTFELTVEDGDEVVIGSSVACEGTVTEIIEISGGADTVYTITSEASCPDTPSGSITILPSRTDIDHDLVIDGGGSHSFTTEFVLENLSEGTHSFCITPEDGVEQCFDMVVESITTLQIESEVKVGTTNTMTFEVISGTSPFSIYVNDELLEQQSENIFELTLENDDRLAIYSSIECEGTFVEEIVFTMPEAEPKDDLISIYPNPVVENDGTLNISFKTIPENCAIKLYDLTGKIMITKIYPVPTSNMVNLNLSNLSTGAYILVVYADGEFSQKRILKK